MERLRKATLQCVRAEVICPHCWNPQLVPDVGDDNWTLEDVSRHAGEITCPLCGKIFTLAVGAPGAYAWKKEARRLWGVAQAEAKRAARRRLHERLRQAALKQRES